MPGRLPQVGRISVSAAGLRRLCGSVLGRATEKAVIDAQRNISIDCRLVRVCPATTPESERDIRSAEVDVVIFRKYGPVSAKQRCLNAEAQRPSSGGPRPFGNGDAWATLADRDCLVSEGEDVIDVVRPGSAALDIEKRCGLDFQL